MSDEQWALVADASRIVRVRPGTIRQWVTRGKVRTVYLHRRVFVSLPDVRRAEKEWRDRVRDERGHLL